MIKKKNNTLYTVNTLADILKTSPENIVEFIAKNNFIEINSIDGEKAVAEESLDFFFRGYASYNKLPYHFYELPDDLQALNRPWSTIITQMYKKRFAFPASVSPGQGQFLKELVCNLNPKLIVEIGCYIGISTLWMASGLEKIRSEGIIHSVDLFNSILPFPPFNYSYLKDPLEFAQTSAHSAGLSHRIQFHKMSSLELGEKYSDIINEPIDFLYIDGDHSILGCLNDFFLFYPYVPINGYIMLHDIYPNNCGWDGPRYFIDKYIKNSPHFDMVEINTTPHNFGMALIRKIGEDKNLYHRNNLPSIFYRMKEKISKTYVWKKIRNTSLGKFIKKRAG